MWTTTTTATTLATTLATYSGHLLGLLAKAAYLRRLRLLQLGLRLG